MAGGDDPPARSQGSDEGLRSLPVQPFRHLGELTTTQLDSWQHSMDVLHEDGQRRQLRLFTDREQAAPNAPDVVEVKLSSFAGKKAMTGYFSPEMVNQLVSSGKAIKEKEYILIDLGKLGYNKLLGTGKIENKIRFKVESCSDGAEEKVARWIRGARTLERERDETLEID